MTLRATRLAFSGLGAVLPEPMALLAERLYFSARRHRLPERERDILDDGVPFTLATDVGVVAASRWEPLLPWERADRGTVLLVHGWEGRASQLGAFIQPLLARGFTVVGADAPGHGRSAGGAIDLRQYGELLGELSRALADDAPPVRAVIAHSFGGAATTLALEAAQLDVDAAVLVAPPCSLDKYADIFSRTLGLTKATEAIFRSRLDARFGKDWARSFALHTRAPAIDTPALIVHDVDDTETAFSEGAQLASAWPRSTLMATNGLGHRRILRDEAVVDAVAAFIDRHV
ncbi:MAG: alpha/beta fold hydrolase [Deltaproteobacteria bacterium]|nr:alpha/beta fold hydrolase [Deltaproteobacteria bacterium]